MNLQVVEFAQGPPCRSDLLRKSGPAGKQARENLRRQLSVLGVASARHPLVSKPFQALHYLEGQRQWRDSRGAVLSLVVWSSAPASCVEGGRSYQYSVLAKLPLKAGLKRI